MNLPLVLEGTWEEIQSRSDQLAGRHVRVIVTPENVNGGVESHPPTRPSRHVYFGMFSGGAEITEEDFKSAEFHGDPDDGLDWA